MVKESESEATQSCLTLCDPMDWSLPGSSVRGILQAGILEWVTMPSSRRSSQPRIESASLTLPALGGGLAPPGKPTGHLYFFFGEMSVKVFSSFVVDGLFFWLSSMNRLYALEIKPLSGMLFTNIFSYSVGSLFFFFYGFLCCAEACKFD